jgi:hypothetical protein
LEFGDIRIGKVRTNQVQKRPTRELQRKEEATAKGKR